MAGAWAAFDRLCHRPGGHSPRRPGDGRGQDDSWQGPFSCVVPPLPLRGAITQIHLIELLPGLNDSGCRRCLCTTPEGRAIDSER